MPSDRGFRGRVGHDGCEQARRAMSDQRRSFAPGQLAAGRPGREETCDDRSAGRCWRPEPRWPSSAATATPAVAATTGSETFRGVLETSGVSGDRTVISSIIVMTGVFSGTGRIVEVPNLPTDPDNVSRDDLVFAEGTFHLLTTNGDISFTLNPNRGGHGRGQRNAVVLNQQHPTR
jgi:hypothetical protein